MTTWKKILNKREPIKTLYEFHKNNGTSDVLAVSKSVLNKVMDGTLQPITGALNENAAKMLTYKDRNIKDVVLIADGGELKVYNGSNVSRVTGHSPTQEEQTDPGLNDLHNLTNFRTFTMKKDRLYAAAHPTVKNRVSFCYIDPYKGYGVYDYFPATHFFDVGSSDNEEIVELRVFRDALIIFCKRSVWALYGDGSAVGELELVKINVPAGCISPGSVHEVGNNLFYLSDDHVYSLFATDRNYISAEVVSNPIQPLMKSIGRSERERATSIFFEDKYYLSFPGGITLVYDITVKAWTKFTNIPANSFLKREGSLFFSSDDGFIYRFNENKFSDDGRPIPFIMKTKNFDFKTLIQKKKFRRMWIVQKQFDNYHSTFDLDIMWDSYTQMNFNNIVVDAIDENAAVWGLSLWDQANWDFSEMAQNELKIRQKGKTAQIIISNNKADEPVSIYGLVFEYKVKKP